MEKAGVCLIADSDLQASKSLLLGESLPTDSARHFPPPS